MWLNPKDNDSDLLNFVHVYGVSQVSSFKLVPGSFFLSGVSSGDSTSRLRTKGFTLPVGRWYRGLWFPTHPYEWSPKVLLCTFTGVTPPWETPVDLWELLTGCRPPPSLGRGVPSVLKGPYCEHRHGLCRGRRILHTRRGGTV